MSVDLQPGALVLKDPSSIEPRGFDWTDYLAGLGDTITTSTWAISGPDTSLQVDSDSIVTGSLKTQAILSGGTVGKRYTVTNAIVTSDGTEDERSFFVKVEQR